MRHNESDDNFEREPGVADALNVEERRVRFLPLFLHPPCRRPSRPRIIACRRRLSGVIHVQGDVTQDGHSHAVVCFEAECQNRRDYEEHREARDHLQSYMYDVKTL